MRKRRIFGWCLYDLADTSFSALFVTFFFPLLIKGFLGGNEFQIGLVMGISMLLSGTMVPFIGAISDIMQKRMIFVITFTIICAVFTAMVGFSSLYFALGFALIANFAYHSALDVYDTKLIDVSNKKTIGIISGYGVALGYIGTVLSLAMAYIIMSYLGWETRESVTLMFPAIAIFYILFALPTFFLVKDNPIRVNLPIREIISRGFGHIKHTFTNLQKYRKLFRFLFASFLFTDGMNTAIIFLYLYGREQINLTVISFFYIFAVFALTSSVGSLVFGKLNDKIGSKMSLASCIIVWIGVVIILIGAHNYTAFMIAGTLGGAALGGIWTVTRPMLVNLAPRHKIAEFFGFQGVTEKYSGIIGPVIFGYVVVKYGYQPALFVLLVLFLSSLIVLRKVPETISY